MNWTRQENLKVLFFDLENKPGTYGGGDYTFPKVTAIGARFLDEAKTHSWCLNRTSMRQMRMDAREFAKLWETADIVAGHNIKRHDIKILGGLYTSLGEPLLPRRYMIDTYMDQPKMAGLSRSLENLADRWDCPQRKIRLSEFDWERAYDGVPAGVRKMRQRVTSDVEINIWLYKELLKRKLL